MRRWTPIFFGFGRYGLALADIVLMWVLIGATIWLFRPVSGWRPRCCCPTGPG